MWLNECAGGHSAGSGWRHELAAAQLGRQRPRPFGIELAQLRLAHLERVRGFRWRADDEPEGVLIAVVEDLAHGVGLDQEGIERLQLQRFLVDPGIRPRPRIST